MPATCPALPAPTPARPALGRRGTGWRGAARRLAAVGVAAVAALALVVVPDLDLVPDFPSFSRPATQGTVTDVPLDLGGGRLLGDASVEGGVLSAPAGGAGGAWESPTLDLGAARMVALSWDSPSGEPEGRAPAAVWVRTGKLIGWSAWERVGADDTAPDPGEGVRGRGFTEGFWTGTAARAFKVRVEVDGGEEKALAGLVAHLVDPGDDEAADGPARKGAAHAATTAPSIVPRRGWGADEKLRKGSKPRYAPWVRAAFVHHTATARLYTRQEATAIIRAIYLYHTRTRGYDDIGYNFLVDRFGRVFEGRAGGAAKAVIGAHTGGFNTGSFSVAVLGDHDRAQVSTAAMSAARRLLAWKLSLHRVDPEGWTVLRSGGSPNGRFAAGRNARLRTISMHRDVSVTACPGKHLASRVPALRAAVAKTIRTHRATVDEDS